MLDGFLSLDSRIEKNKGENMVHTQIVLEKVSGILLLGALWIVLQFTLTNVAHTAAVAHEQSHQVTQFAAR